MNDDDVNERLTRIEQMLEKFNNLDQLSYLENLQKLSALEKLKILDDMPLLNELVKQLENLKNFDSENKIDQFLTQLDQRMTDFKEQKNLNKLDKLDKLELLNTNKWKLIGLNFFTGILDLIKIFALTAIVIAFILYLPQNFISDNFVKFLQLNKLYNSSFVLSSLQSSMGEKEYSEFVESFRTSLEVQIDDYWQPYSNDSITQKFVKLDSLKRIQAGSLPTDLKLHIKRYYQEKKDNTEAYFEEISTIVYLEAKERPELLSLYRQTNISYFKDSCDSTVLNLKKLKKKNANIEFVRTAEALTLNCLYQKERIKTIKDLAQNFIKLD